MLDFKELFGNIGNIIQLKKRLEDIQKSLKGIYGEAESGGGMVKAVCDGQQNLIELYIDPDLIKRQDKKLIEDLVVSAVNEARKRALAKAQAELKKTIGDIPINIDDVDSILPS